MRKIEVCRKMCRLGTPELRTVVYYITADSVDFGTGGELECYGVGIAIPETREDRHVRWITTSAAAAEEMADRLATGTVTPVALSDVVSDWMSA